MNNVYDLIAHAAQSYAKGDFSELNGFCDRILQIDAYNTDALTLKAVANRRMGNAARAIRLLRAAVAIDPLRLDAQLNLADGIESQNQPDQAARIYRRVLIIDRMNIRAATALVRLYEAKLVLFKAVNIYQLLAAINPEQSQIYAALGAVASVSLKSNLAYHHMRRAVLLALDDANLRYSIALVFGGADSDKKTNTLRQAICLDPGNAKLWTELGRNYREDKDINDELKAFYIACMIDPFNVGFKTNKALSEFRKGIKTGDLESAWRARLNFHFSEEPTLPDCVLETPIWNGKVNINTKLLIIAREGIGDQIQFSSCIPNIIMSVGRVFVACNRRLSKLFQRSFPAASIISDMKSIDANEHIYMDALPIFFRKRITDFPAWRRYLVADDKETASWRSLFSFDKDRIIIGVSWRTVATPIRSIALSDFLSVFTKNTKITLVNLQYACDELALANAGMETDITIVHHLNHELISDLDRWAAQIAACDLVITIDTSLAHMAGALGVETWVLLPQNAEIRWEFSKTETPWYPAARLFRQKEAGNWDSPLGEIRAALEDRTCGVERTPY